MGSERSSIGLKTPLCPPQSQSVEEVPESFSLVHTYRRQDQKDETNLALYDEKVYTEVSKADFISFIVWICLAILVVLKKMLH